MCLNNKGCHRLKGQIQWATLHVVGTGALLTGAT